MSELDMAIAAALEAIDFPPDHPRYRHGKWRLILRGPWRLSEGIQWMAVAEPHNATGHGLDKEIEASGPTPSAALFSLAIQARR